MLVYVALYCVVERLCYVVVCVVQGWKQWCIVCL